MGDARRMVFSIGTVQNPIEVAVICGEGHVVHRIIGWSLSPSEFNKLIEKINSRPCTMCRSYEEYP